MTRWKASILAARKLRGETAAIVYERIVLLDRVFDDAKFREENDYDDIQAADHLDAEIGDLAADFLTLRRVLKKHPGKNQWDGADLRLLIADTLEADGAQARQNEPAKAVKRATMAELESAIEAAKLAEARLVMAEKRIVGLETENTRLREQVAMLQGRVLEMERIISRELAVA